MSQVMSIFETRTRCSLLIKIVSEFLEFLDTARISLSPPDFRGFARVGNFCIKAIPTASGRASETPITLSTIPTYSGKVAASAEYYSRRSI